MGADVKLVVEIKNRDPVQLLDLTQALVSFAREFQTYADEALDGPYRAQTHLYVKEIRTGSIITELVANAAGLLPIVSDANTLIGFTKHLTVAINWLLHRTPEKNPPSISRSTVQNIGSIVEPIAKDSASQLIIHTETINHAPVFLTINSHDANALQNQIQRQLADWRAPATGMHEKVVMYWFQARNDAKSTAGDKAKIESISQRPVKVIFASEAIKAQMLAIDENIFTHAFIVDVQVETVENSPVLYKIVRVYEGIGLERELP